MLPRYYGQLKDLLPDNKVLILYGSRRVGKTTLLKKILSASGLRYKIDSGESIRVNQVLSSNDFGLLSEYVEGFDVVAIDEAQEIDLIVEKDGKLKAYEFKWKKDAGRLPNDFKKEVRSHRISDSQPKKLFGIPSIGIISIELY